MYRDAAPRLQRMLASYLDGGRSLLEFQQEFIELYVRLPGGALRAGDATFWHEVFALVTTAAPDDAELKGRLGEMWRGRREKSAESLSG